MRALLGLLVAAAVAVAPSTASAARGPCVAGVPGPGCTVWKAKVASVNDGDTMDVDVLGDGRRTRRRIRVSGVQAMELSDYARAHRRGACRAVDATLRVEQLVRRSHGLVRLAAQDPASASERRPERTVAYRQGGRWHDVGSVLVREGLALWWPLNAEWAPNAAYSRLTQRALIARRGLFDPAGCGVGPYAASPLKLWANWDETGHDPADEWIKIQNLDPVNPVSLQGWWVRDAGQARFRFPPTAVLAPGATITVDVGTERVDAMELSWNRRRPIFTDPSYDERARGDGAYLFDPLGNVRAATVFPCRVSCTDPLQGAVSVAVDPSGRDESIVIANVAAGPIDLYGYVLKYRGLSYAFPPGSAIPPGGALRVVTTADPSDDTPLVKGWGAVAPILRDAGGSVRLLTYTDIPLGCAAWGDGAC